MSDYIILPRAAVEQALEAMRCAVPTGKITLYEWDKAMAELTTALAQQAEPVEPVGRVVSANCEYATVQWLKQTSDVGGGDPQNSRSWPIAGDAVYTAPPQQAEPVEPVAWVRLEAWKSGKDWPDDCFTALPAEGLTPLYTAPPQRKPLMDEEIVRIAREAGLGWDEKYHWYVGSESLVRFARLIHTRGQA